MRRLALALCVLATAAACSRDSSPKPIVLGVPTTAATTTAAPSFVLPTEGPPGPEVVDLRAPARKEPAPAPNLKRANGRSPGGALVFRSSTPVPDDLVFMLIVGSDARPREDMRRANGDSIHILAVNPASGQGTIVGIPRDAWVEVPGRGNQKLSTVLHGGPELFAKTVRHLSGLPMEYYALTGFNGLPAMVDELGGVDVFVDRRMNDPYSGARFERGWHHFDGQDALAFSRNRHDTAHGDFSRSENQGTLVLAALAKLRHEVTDDGGLRKWIDVLLRHTELDVPRDRLPGLAALARSLDPSDVRNIVTPGRVGTANGQSVVFLGHEAAAIFDDLRADAVLGRAGPATTTTTEPPPTTTTTSTAPSSTVPPLFGTTSTTAAP
ncbi:MAG TPA: LCP family protein [Acidimicrobiales bacterium]|nr:LCP family protein [Acidimicrobiales bacterium]